MEKRLWRKFLSTGGILGVLTSLVACGSGTGSGGSASSQPSAAAESPALPQTDTVVVGVYSGDWEKNIDKAALDAFADETGIDVEIVSGADAEWYTKLAAANGENVPYDLLILQPDTIQKAISGGLLQEMDETNVPNLSQLYDSVSERFTQDGKL